MSDSAEERIPQTQTSFSGRPPSPPKITARDLEDSDDPQKTIRISDPVVVKDLAIVLKLKPFKVVADLMDLRQFKQPDDLIDFETASVIARAHGYRAQRTFSY